MLRRWGTLVLILLTTPLVALAQNTGKLTGTVTDAETGEPLPGANVVIQDTRLGAATGAEGNYTIIGVPVGTYDVQASFVGYQTMTVSDVEINADVTRQMDFELRAGQQLEEVTVAYEEPIIQNDAIGASRTISSADIENLPVRGATNVAALQGGVVSNAGSGDLFIRGGREQEVQYYVDGVKIVGQSDVPQQAIQEQEVMIGTISPRYGDAQSGVISITTKSGVGSDFFGTVEGITSEVLDDYGYNLASLSLGGPIIDNTLSFFVSAEGDFQSDANPYGAPTPRLRDDLYNDLQQNPQVVRISDEEGERLVPFPSGFEQDTIGSAQILDQLEEEGVVEEGASIVGDPQPRALTFTEEDFVEREGKDRPSRNISLNGNFTLNPVEAVNLRLGGGYVNDHDEYYSYGRSFYNRDRQYERTRRTWRVFGNWRQRLSDATFYTIQADYSDDRYWRHPSEFGQDVEETLFYGDTDAITVERNDAGDVIDTTGTTPAEGLYDVVDRYYTPVGNGQYARQYTSQGDAVFPGSAYGLFSLPGSGISDYRKFQQQQFRISANATTQAGVHQIEFGGEFEQRTQRYFRIGASTLARYYADANPELGEGVTEYTDLPYQAINQANISRYGYNIYGTEETDEENLALYEQYAEGFESNEGFQDSSFVYDRAPYQPIYYGGYVRDKIEFMDLVLDLGLRVDVFDNNSQVLRDPFATAPIGRADALDNRPGNIGSDYAVYYEGGDPSNDVVGYRDLSGNFYDESGESATISEVTNVGSPSEIEDASVTELLEDYEPQVTFMPRVGVSFPVTNQSLFFASYNVLSQRPTEASFTPATSYTVLETAQFISNPNLRPERTTQYEIGYRQRIGARAALQLTGFYRTQDGKIAVRDLATAYPTDYNSYFNQDFTTTKGATFEFDLRRTNNVSINANYTLQFAEGTGSDASTLQTIAWRGNYYPDFLAPASFDRRHTINLTVDYRLGEEEGPTIFGARLLENFGVNVLATVQSGMPYTQLSGPINLPVDQNITNDIQGSINSAYMPWSNRIDLRLDRQFNLGGADLTAFLWVQNLLDSDNVLGVYRGTGQPDDDGFLNTREAQAYANQQFSPESYLYHYQSYIGNPQGLSADDSFTGPRAYAPPRRTRLGVRLNF